ncbi:TetR/AcrR family transcriptional regulator [Clostridium saccharobutylicum]|uniref:Biofilm operon icaADBC HTH-type negative transcriptional regulator IcaR n=1 Tax=Clostridium saccharobutylicum TaxID=169679 RepID=A0A1S8N3T2_CLOSA|nr:TetR/AcrR family transcriptional regulator [Clostridium saccharobutylicum]OOM11080.1 biofilm operon icaADBC HTH-type negative transcriptional regulator IcaR [Clostridium saccharobutylicum]
MNKTKSLIFKSAIKVFSECGYRGATMDDIASNAKLAKGTLYYHFTSKEEIFNFIVEEGLQILQNEVVEVQKMNIGPIEKLIRICKLQLSFLYGYNDFFKVVMSQLWGNEQRQEYLRLKIRKYINEIQTNIQVAMDEGKIESSNSELMAYEFFGALCSAAIYKSIHTEKINLDDIINNTVQFTLKGFGIQV